MWCNTLIHSQILKNPCISRIKPAWSWCMIFLICCWIVFARILLRIFASLFISEVHQTPLVAQTVKGLSTIRETQVWALGWEDPLEKEMATHSSILAWRIPWTEELDGLQSTGRKEPDTTERLHFHFQWLYNIQLKTSREVLFLPPSDAYVRSFLYLLYTLIKFYYTKALSNRASSLASDWILLQGPRIPVSFCDSTTTFQEHFLIFQQWWL